MPFFGVPIRNGLPIGLGSVAGFGVQQFDPLELFASGAPGVWYDPSDTSTLFQDPAGTTPVTAVEQPVGLMLDKSKGLVPGSELRGTGTISTVGSPGTLATFNTSTGAGSAFRLDGSNTSGVQIAVSDGRTYLVDVEQLTGTLQIRGTGPAGNQLVTSVIGRQTYRLFVSAGEDLFFVTGTNAASVTFTVHSVRELPGNHAISYNGTTARPTLSARVNLLTYSEDFGNAAWIKLGPDPASYQGTGLQAVVTANQGVAPDGTLTADRIVLDLNGGTTDNDRSGIYQNPMLASNFYTYSVYVKSLDTTSSTNLAQALTTNINPAGTAIVTVIGNGWVRAVWTSSSAFAPGSVRIQIRGSAGLNSADFLIWGADLRVSNIGSAIPSYQRIAAATDYDTDGFPKYLYFAGTDDGMSTPANLNLTSTDKVTVFSGVRKLSDAAAAVLTELSALIASNNGAFAILGPSSAAGNNLRFVSKGTIVSESNTTAVSPISGVITGVGDISGDVCQFRFNGSVTQTTTTDQGTGDYGSYPLYIGARNNASGWFNGYLYGLTVVGAQLTTPQIESMETWTAQRTGITL